MKKVIVFSLLFVFTRMYAQNIRYSSVYIQTFYHHHQHFSMNESSLVTFDAHQQEFSIPVDFSKFKSGIDSLDEWLLDLADTKLIFKAGATEEQFSGLSNHNSRTIHLKGTATLNGESHPLSVDLTIFEISTQGLQYQNIQDNQFDKIRFNCSFNFMPKDFKIDKKPHHLKKSIAISFGNGFINYLRQ